MKNNDDHKRKSYFRENPLSSTRIAGMELDSPRSTVYDVLKVSKYHPYMLTILEGLQPDDLVRKINFCN